MMDRTQSAICMAIGLFLMLAASNAARAGYILPLPIAIVSWLCLIVGCCGYAVSKGHSPWYGLFAVLVCIGPLVVLLLRDRTRARVRTSYPPAGSASVPAWPVQPWTVQPTAPLLVTPLEESPAPAPPAAARDSGTFLAAVACTASLTVLFWGTLMVLMLAHSLRQGPIPGSGSAPGFTTTPPGWPQPGSPAPQPGFPWARSGDPWDPSDDLGKSMERQMENQHRQMQKLMEQHRQESQRWSDEMRKRQDQRMREQQERLNNMMERLR